MDDSADEGAVRFIVTGRVQGVGFRAWTRRLAAELGVRGWVRNRADGSVEIHVSGRGEALGSFRDRVSEGPAFARVEGVKTMAGAEDLPDSGFEVRW